MQRHENLITPEQAVTLDGLFALRVRRSGLRPAYRYHDRRQKGWLSLTWDDAAALVARWQSAIAGEQLAAGERVALVLRNGPEWIAFDQAALSQGLVTVPLYTDDRPENVAFILQETGTRLLLVQDAGRWKRLAPVLADCPSLKRVVLLEGGQDAQELLAADDRLRLAADWLPETGGQLKVRQGGKPHDLATIVYTSGTTGRPKGVMLSHHNIMSVAHAGLILIDVYEQDSFLSFLPLSHTLERTGGYYLPIMAGAEVAYARSVNQLAEDLAAVQPTVFIAVPRVFERVYQRLQDKLHAGPAVGRMLFQLATDVGWRHAQRTRGLAGWRPSLLLWPLLDRLVGSKLRARLGGRLRAAVSGGAAMPPSISRVFIGLGLPIIQGYGLTETSPVVSVNPLDDIEPGSVGPPVRGVTVRIGEDDELLVRGPGVMLGYWNNHVATAQMIDADGWLHTGDQARIDREGRIYITGRLKDILVLSNGEKIPPGDMEQAIILDPAIEQVMVVGEGRSYLSALVVLNGDYWPGLAQRLGLDPLVADSLKSPELAKDILGRIRRALSGFPGYAKIRRVALTLEPWTIDNGLLTPTMKVKRPKVTERFAADIDRLYEGGIGG